MFFVLSKVLDVAVDPLWWGVGLGLAALRLSRTDARRRLAGRLGLAAVVLPLVAATPVVSETAWWLLERDPPSSATPADTFDAVVLLGGAVDFDGSTAETPSWNDNVDRLHVVFELLRTGRAKRAILSGGIDREALPAEGAYLQRQLVAWGIDPARVEVEDQARNTRENATFSKRLLDAHGDRSVLIVTSAFHMPRALGCFRAVGLEPATLAVDFRMRSPWATHKVLPRAESLAQTTRVLREVLGRAVYRVLGYAKG